MRVLQATPHEPEAAISRAQLLGCEAVAWDLREPCEAAREMAAQAGLRSEGWLQVARDPEAAAEHPEWMHCPPHREWLRHFPEFHGPGPALVAPYIGLNTQRAFEYALYACIDRVSANPWAPRIWLADIQGPPMGCGCGNPCCRSWDNAPGEKVAPPPYHDPDVLFPLGFYWALSAGNAIANHAPALVAVLCPECERGISLGGVSDPDGPDGTDLCGGIPCSSPCTDSYWPALLQAFRADEISVGLLLAADALGKNHPAFGPPRSWVRAAHQHYGSDLVPCVEPEDADEFEHCLILTDAPQDCWPVDPPRGYIPALPPLAYDYTPTSS